MQESVPTTENPWNQIWAILLRPLPGSQEKSKPRMIGMIGILREHEIGYKLHSDFWGKGYMTEALRIFIDMYWEMEGRIFFSSQSAKKVALVGIEGKIHHTNSVLVNKGYDELLAAADPVNKASGRILEKAGFQKGEYRTGFYELVVDGVVIKGDLQCFYLSRPHSS